MALDRLSILYHQDLVQYRSRSNLSEGGDVDSAAARNAAWSFGWAKARSLSNKVPCQPHAGDMQTPVMVANADDNSNSI